MRVVVTYNDDVAFKTHLNEIERIGEEEVADAAREVSALLNAALQPVRDVRSAIDELRQNKPDLVFNLCEGVQGHPRWEMHFALALEMLGIPFTGCDPIAVGICGDKWMTKRLLASSGISTPRGYLVTTEDRGPRTEDGVWIVKPSLEDAGIGIDEASICTAQAEVAARCAHVIKTYRQPALVEEFIDGPEFNQSMFYGSKGLVVLPPGEIIFSGRHRVVGWKAKWSEGSDEDRATRNRTPAAIDDTLRRDIAELCTRAAGVLSIGGYCRFDLRQRPSGELCIIDVNPNPDIGRDSGFRKALAAAGIAYTDYLNELMIAARGRN